MLFVFVLWGPVMEVAEDQARILPLKDGVLVVPRPPV
jgi:hypothetical protein